MTFLGNPQDAVKMIHIAGTSGKTSTAYYIDALLRAKGYSTGLSVSPHIDVISERAQINSASLNEFEYCQDMTHFLSLVDQSKENLSYFEILVAFAYWEFAKHEVDYAVIETGLGGLLDGTNVVSRHDKVSVITDIGYDHQEILGNTLEQIALQKAGIIVPESHVFMQTQTKEITHAIKSVITTQNASLHIANSAKLDLDLPLFQQRNLALAKYVADYILQQDGNVEIDGGTLQQAAKVHIPARMEEVVYNNCTVILDGSHNPQKLRALVLSVQKKYMIDNVPIMVGFGNNKHGNMHKSLAELRKVSTDIILTKFSDYQDELRAAIDPSFLRQICQSLNFEHVTVIDDPIQAFDALVHKNNGIVMVTGSYYLLNHIRPIVWQKH